MTGSVDGTTKVWDAGSGEEVITLSGYSNWVMSASYNPAGDRIVTGSGDGTTKVWPVDGDGLIELADSRIQRYPPRLTPDERERYGLE